VDDLSAKGFLFVGCGVSGGEEGALNGPSLMPGGDPAAWPAIKPILQAIAAKVEDGSPCCDWVGKGGAGHFVKMVHNGIEYGDMQLLCEGYTIMRKLLGMSNAEMADTFDAWNNVELKSYLVEITRDILRHKDTETPDKDTVDLIVDRAGQKGTGKWTAVAALDAGMPLTLIGEAVFGRTLSAQKEERVSAAKLLGAAANPEVNPTLLQDRQKHIDALRGALYASKLVSYAQGFVLMREVSREFNWDLQYGPIALLWRQGCVRIACVCVGLCTTVISNSPRHPCWRDDFTSRKIPFCCRAARLFWWFQVVLFSHTMLYFTDYSQPIPRRHQARV
jgi:6-phosphogluconate dehydrogenase